MITPSLPSAVKTSLLIIWCVWSINAQHMTRESLLAASSQTLKKKMYDKDVFLLLELYEILYPNVSSLLATIACLLIFKYNNTLGSCNYWITYLKMMQLMKLNVCKIEEYSARWTYIFLGALRLSSVEFFFLNSFVRLNYEFFSCYITINIHPSLWQTTYFFYHKNEEYSMLTFMNHAELVCLLKKTVKSSIN